MLYFILGLLFAIPLSVAGNLLTPWAKNWYALSSKKRAAKRLKVLETQLAEIESRQPMTELMIGLKYLFMVLSMITFGLFTCMTLFITNQLRESEPSLQSSWRAGSAIVMLYIVAYLLFLGSAISARFGSARFVRDPSPMNMNYFKKAIVKLKAKLEPTAMDKSGEA